MSILKVENLGISFGGLRAVDGVSFELEPGEIMGLIGPNGAGKTTTLNLISGIYTTDSGSVYLDNENITALPTHKRSRRGLARTFQTPRFLNRSTIRENLLLGTDLADQMGFVSSFIGKKGRNFNQEVESLLQKGDLEIDWNMDVDSLPYGQRKRLEIVRALLTHPKVILIDEPAAGLNEKELASSVKLMRYATSIGVGIILIEHKMDMIMNVCDRILVLNFGRPIGYGTPAEISQNEAVIEAYLGRDDDAED
ncbi:MAG TPA: ABC transporter ATP-binding protein [Candidatus Enterocloster excrementigallinarum]|uniref:ABC transporter ATP-binding protein n=1 Tax=Candidatus Enterocloster excrementigallinarum TaxID=2838558 RepID=A0A9D2TGC0_9FIRM|nr:ABC transporter ATP-binding protein [Candidatus Enterocloster excrementigallinarum]